MLRTTRPDHWLSIAFRLSSEHGKGCLSTLFCRVFKSYLHPLCWFNTCLAHLRICQRRENVCPLLDTIAWCTLLGDQIKLHQVCSHMHLISHWILKTLCDVSHICWSTVYTISSWTRICLFRVKDGMISTALFLRATTFFKSSHPSLIQWVKLLVVNGPSPARLDDFEFDDNFNTVNYLAAGRSLATPVYLNSGGCTRWINFLGTWVCEHLHKKYCAYSVASLHMHQSKKRRLIRFFKDMSKWWERWRNRRKRMW